MDLLSLIEQMLAASDFRRITENPFAQFGTPTRSYVGAELLPERDVTENAYREDAIRFRTVIAADGSRYSPAQRRDGSFNLRSMLVELSEQDVHAELTSRDLDAIIRLTNQGRDLEAAGQVIRFVDVTVNQALVESTERMRWQALVAGQINHSGDNGIGGTTAYPNPAGHRAAAASAWSTDSYDPFADLLAMAQQLRDKGYQPSRIVTSSAVVAILVGNDKIAQRAGAITVSASGALQSGGGFATRDTLNAALQGHALPPIETYDLTYLDATGTRQRFLPANALVMVSQTGMTEEFAVEDQTRVVGDTLGYTAIGRAAGQGDPGRAVDVQLFTNKPPRLVAEGWQTALPVITEPEAVGVITAIS